MAITDAPTRRVLEAVVSNFQVLFGISGTEDQRAILVGDAKAANMVRFDDERRMHSSHIKDIRKAFLQQLREVSSPAALVTSGYRVGSASIGNGVSTGSVTGLGLSAAPTKIITQVCKPTNTGAGSFNLWATVIDDTIDTDGFDFELDAATDTATYRLAYLVVP